MSYTTLDSIQWGGTPLIGVSFAYEGQRSGSSMQYRIRVTIDPSLLLRTSPSRPPSRPS